MEQAPAPFGGRLGRGIQDANAVIKNKYRIILILYDNHILT
jgi:hypothetical protein